MVNLFCNYDESDQNVIEFSNICNKFFDLIEDQIQVIGNRPINGNARAEESLRRFTMYIATLFNEQLIAANQLGLFAMTRSHAILNRQLFEYFIRLKWLYMKPEKATEWLNTLPKKVLKEVEQSGDAFCHDTKNIIINNIKEWLKNHHEFDNYFKESSFKTMVEEVIGSSKSDEDYFFHYTIPSFLIHGKPQLINDVFSIADHGKLQRSQGSLSFDRYEEYFKTISFGLFFATIIAQNYSLPQDKIKELDNKYSLILANSGRKVEYQSIKK